jgi:hypothetical protein
MRVSGAWLVMSGYGLREKLKVASLAPNEKLKVGKNPTWRKRPFVPPDYWLLIPEFPPTPPGCVCRPLLMQGF